MNEQRKWRGPGLMGWGAALIAIFLVMMIGTTVLGFEFLSPAAPDSLGASSCAFEASPGLCANAVELGTTKAAEKPADTLVQISSRAQVVPAFADHCYKANGVSTKLMQLALPAEDPVPPYWVKPSRRQGTLKNLGALLNNMVKSSQLGIAATLFGMTSFLVLGPKGLVMAGGLYLAGALPTSAAASTSSGHEDCECEGDTTGNITWTIFDWIVRIVTTIGALQVVKHNCVAMLAARANRRRAEEEANERRAVQEAALTDEETASSAGHRDEEDGGSSGAPAPLPADTPRTSWFDTFEAVCNAVNAVFARQS